MTLFERHNYEGWTLDIERPNYEGWMIDDGHDRITIRRAEPSALCTDYCGANGERRAARYMIADDYGSAPEYLCQSCMEDADFMRESRGLEFFKPRR